MLRSIDFIHGGRRYRGNVAPVPGGGPEFADGAWFVSMNGGLELRVFEAHRDDADTPELRHRHRDRNVAHGGIQQEGLWGAEEAGKAGSLAEQSQDRARQASLTRLG